MAGDPGVGAGRRPGTVEVPPHLGREGSYFGLPHLAIIVPKEGKTIAVTPAK